MTRDIQQGDQNQLTIVVIGASGDLAQKKIFPALFSLYSQDFLPARFQVFGLARTPYTHAEFRDKLTEHLTCRYVPGERCADYMSRFLSRCFYQPGQYESAGSFLDLYQAMTEVEGGAGANRLYYLAIPPSVFLATARSIGDAALVSCGTSRWWSRVVIEKPFGRDRQSSDQLAQGLADVFAEAQTFRIDHYLGKEVIQNLMVLRFMNAIFEPIWNRAYMESVQIDWKEDVGVLDRGRYFDGYGIIRDVMQNHLLQILALLAMEEPASMDARAVGDEKVKVLRAVRPPGPSDMVVGQYGAGTIGGVPQPAYRQERAVPPDSRTPTYGAAVLRVNNERWRGVPFLITAGKALGARETLIRIRFRQREGSVASAAGPSLPANEFVIRVQPDEAIYYTITNKVPGLAFRTAETKLDLRYQDVFTEPIPDAYERLLLDVIAGEHSLFIRSDELAAAWEVFTPVLRDMEQRHVEPEIYAAGGPGPVQVHQLALRNGFRAR